jgi:formate hydrogenlyase subunit 3/multisubunit Na+/H+ antiporter MnhD subunit
MGCVNCYSLENERSGRMLTPEQSVLLAILVCIGGAVLTLLVSRSKVLAGWVSFFVTAASAVLILSAAVRVLTAGPSVHPVAFGTMPSFGFVLRMYIDGLTAVFLLLAGGIAVPAALYSILYMRHYHDYGVARYYPYFLLFLAAIYGLLSTTDMMWFFFIFWQLMTLPGYALIRFEYRKRETVRAANRYLVMMQIACLAIMIGAALMAPARNSALDTAGLRYDFDTVSAHLPLMLSTRPLTTAIAFGLFLIGFGIKMGMWPFGQVWLPEAHPAAPSPVSAMLSGVMIKTGVYGLMRYFLWLVPISAIKEYPLENWGMLVAVLGTITLFSGTAQALKQEQSKRLLAFSSIGQIGYILLGTGTCMALLPLGTSATAALATIAFSGALFHVLNHGVFKSLLFLNAGSMLYATGTQDLNKMGGMMKYMPLTAITALIASFSISGVPLFNGFVSKWCIYVAAIQGSGSAHYLVVCAVVAILTSVLTLATFIKFFGVSFLSRCSTHVKRHAAEHDLEVPPIMQLPQFSLAVLCLLLGVVPALGFYVTQHAIEASRSGLGTVIANASVMLTNPLLGVTEGNFAALYAPLILAAIVGVMFLLAYSISRLGSATRRTAEPWLCGYAREADCHRYVAHNFYAEIKRHLRWPRGLEHGNGSAALALKDLR